MMPGIFCHLYSRYLGKTPAKTLQPSPHRGTTSTCFLFLVQITTMRSVLQHSQMSADARKN